MEENLAKEHFSKAYVRAIAAVGRYGTYIPEPDDDSVDIGFCKQGGNGTVRSPRLEAQLKCTSQDILKNNTLNFPLEMKNYNDLRAENIHVPRILIVVLVPNKFHESIEHSEDALIMKHCGYFISLRGYEASTSKNKITIKIPRENMFSVISLTDMMEKIAEGIMP